MGKFQIRYPFGNEDNSIVDTTIYDRTFSNEITQALFKGEKNIGDKYGAYTFSIGGNVYWDGVTITYTPTFLKAGTFKFYMPFPIAVHGGNLYLARNIDKSYNNMYDYNIYGRDYSKIPLYSFESDSTYMFAVDDLANLFMITERAKIDDPTSRGISIFMRKTNTGTVTDSAPIGCYEFNDNSANSGYLDRTNLYTDSAQYNSCNTGYCNKYMMYQYTNNGYIYPDIYYCDGGMATPPDGIIRIGPSKFLKIASNIFLKIG